MICKNTVTFSQKYPWSTNKVNLYVEPDEYINLKFLTSDLIDYYIQSKRIGNLSNTGRYVDYVHMLPILFKIKDILIKQEKEDRLHIPAKDYDLNLLTAFKITNTSVTSQPSKPNAIVNG